MKLATMYMKRVTIEFESMRNSDRESTQEALLLQGVHFAYRAHQVTKTSILDGSSLKPSLLFVLEFAASEPDQIRESRTAQLLFIVCVVNGTGLLIVCICCCAVCRRARFGDIVRFRRDQTPYPRTFPRVSTSAGWHNLILRTPRSIERVGLRIAGIRANDRRTRSIFGMSPTDR